VKRWSHRPVLSGAPAGRSRTPAADS